MESSTWRVVAAVVVCVAILLVWERFFAPRRASGPEVTQRDDRPVSAQEKGSGPASRPTGSAREDRASEAENGLAGGRRATSAEGHQSTLEWPAAKARLTFTDRGAALRHAVLLDGRFKEIRNGELRQVDLVQTKAGRGPWPLVTTVSGSDFEVPADAEFELVEQGSGTRRYVWRSDKVSVSKQFVVDKKRPLLWMTVRLRNVSQGALRHRLELGLFSRQGEKEEAASITNPYPRMPTALCQVGGELVRRSASSIHGKKSGCGPGGCGVGSGEFRQIGLVRWIGTDDRYFLTAVVPRGEKAERMRCAITGDPEDANIAAVSLLYPEKKLAPGAVVERKFAVFLGAKELDVLDSVKGAGGEDALLKDAIQFGWFSFISRPMLALMKAFHRVTGNWGIAIILLTLLVKLATLYWSTKSMRSMRSMQRLKPKIDELRERFKDDKQRLNQEMMALYKVHRVSPLGGCLPMLIQMPIWFALYSTLGNSQELYRSGFLGWITDLTASDPYYVLPIAVGAAMFAQQAISPQPMEGAQAKMMKYFMPGMFSIFMMWLPAGLTLYILVNTVLTMLHQWYINKTDPIPAGGGASGASTARAGVSRAGGAAPGGQQGAALPSGRKAGSGGKKRRKKKTRA